MKLNFRTLAAIAGILAAAIEIATARAQTVETHGVEVISAEEFGPFRPTHEADLQRAARLIEEMTNRFRAEHEREAIESNDKLERVATDFAAYMARTGRYGHYATGEAPSQRVKDHDYDFCVAAENIAYDFRTSGFSTDKLAENIFAGWKDSPEHRKNMLLPAVTHTGVAIVQSPKTGVYFAVQEFGRPKSAALEFQIANRSDATVEYRLADHEYKLLPRFVRTHTICQPEELTLLRDGEAVSTLRPADGDRFSITGTADQLRVQRATE